MKHFDALFPGHDRGVSTEYSKSSLTAWGTFGWSHVMHILAAKVTWSNSLSIFWNKPTYGYFSLYISLVHIFKAATATKPDLNI